VQRTSFLPLDFDKGGKKDKIGSPLLAAAGKTKMALVISVLQTAAPQKCYHVTRIFEPRTETQGP